MSLTLKIIISSILLLLLLVAGIYIHRTGKPYNTMVFTVHKLFTVAVVVLLAIVFVQVFRSAGLSSGQIAILSVMILAIVVLMVSGGMMSLDKKQIVMLWLHRLSTAAFLVCYILFVYRILSGSFQSISL